MKTTILFLLAALSLAACHDDSPSKSTQATNVENIAKQGPWQITRFEDSGSDQTSNFNGFAFMFNDAGELKASSISAGHTGTWSITDNDSSDDNPNYDDIDFNIAFTTPSAFQELTEDWEILSITSTKIELRHISGGNGGTDFLTFEKL
ncbi:hypothetical protein [Chryseolinea lacunae]|uniref:Lipocalin-like domain-containing protein n=1 Tax=Chryseolinea lacunae TaxID=2801331 RepID=A0ABS1KQH8_9BACT|nr:hypothetical protein [Chryseolinea lacunae]MBL0740541.1 hypothetical protein [Chryseolinea lacunae]